MSLSKNPGFSSFELSALKTWNLPNISDGSGSGSEAQPSKSVDVAEDITPVLTVDEIEAMQKQAYDEAFGQGKQDGFQQGFDHGFQEGSRKGYEDNAELLRNKATEFADLMASLSEPFKTLDDEVEKELVKLSIGIATQIIRREIKMDPGQVVAAVRETINVLPLSSQKINLHLHPEDAALVRSALSLDDMSPAWGVIEDPLITRGGCKVDTDVSHVDATVENRLAAVIASVFGGERERDCRDAGGRATQGAVADDCRDAGGIPSRAQGATQGRQTAPAFAAFSTSCTSAVAEDKH